MQGEGKAYVMNRFSTVRSVFQSGLIRTIRTIGARSSPPAPDSRAGLEENHHDEEYETPAPDLWYGKVVITVITASGKSGYLSITLQPFKWWGNGGAQCWGWPNLQGYAHSVL